MHTRDVDVGLAQHRSDSSNHARLIVIREKHHVSARDNLERISIDFHDARQLICKHGSRYAVSFDVGLQLDDDEVREVLGRRYASLQNSDPALFGDVHRVDQVYTLSQHRHEKASNNDGAEIVEVHFRNFAGVSDGNGLHAAVANLNK